jgi:hypothetical protein
MIVHGQSDVRVYKGDMSKKYDINFFMAGVDCDYLTVILNKFALKPLCAKVF